MDIVYHQVRESAAFGLVTELVSFDTRVKLALLAAATGCSFEPAAAPSAEPVRIQAQPWGGF